MIICDNDKLYDIDPLFGLYEADDYVCHGYRVETLKCVLDETTELSAEERIMKAIIFVSELHKEGVLYEICRNFSIYKYEDFQLLGYGVDYGQFVLANTKDTDDVNERIIKTLDTIAKYSHHVGSPYLLIDTKEQKYKLIRRANV